MSGPTPPSPGHGGPGRQRSGLRALSGSLSLSAAASAWAQAAPALHSELHSQHPRQHQPAPLAPFAMRPLDPAASLEMFKRMRGPPASSSAAAEGPSPAKPSAPPLHLGDSARHTETEDGTPTSQRSLLESADEGWGSHSPEPPPPAAGEQPAAQPAADAGPVSSGSQPTPFAAAFPRQLSPPSSGLVSPPSGGGSGVLPPGLRAELLSQLSAMHAAAAPAQPAPELPAVQQQEQQMGAGSGADTPHSIASWPSVLSGTVSTLPQTEAELQCLDAADIERLAVEAAELQARAATALRLAQRRLQAAGPAARAMASGAGGAPGGSSGSAVDGTAAGEGSEPASRPAPGAVAAIAPGSVAAAAVAASPSSSSSLAPAASSAAAAATSLPPLPPSLPPAAQHLLQLFILLLAVGEALLLWGAQAVQAGSGGRLRVPRSLALAPLAPARAALPALLLTADSCLVLLAVLRSQRWAAAGL